MWVSPARFLSFVGYAYFVEADMLIQAVERMIPLIRPACGGRAPAGRGRRGQQPGGQRPRFVPPQPRHRRQQGVQAHRQAGGRRQDRRNPAQPRNLVLEVNCKVQPDGTKCTNATMKF